MYVNVSQIANLYVNKSSPVKDNWGVKNNTVYPVIEPHNEIKLYHEIAPDNRGRYCIMTWHVSLNKTDVIWTLVLCNKAHVDCIER